MSSTDALTPPAPLQRPRAAAWLALGRVSNAPTVVANVLAGAWLATSAPEPANVALTAAAMVCFYVAGMVLNDVLDLSIDSLQRRERPLVTGEISRSAARWATGALFGTGAALLALTGAGALLAGMVLIALIFVYDAWHKGNPLAPVLMAGTRVMVYVVAFAAVGGREWLPVLPAAILLGGYVVGLTQIARAAHGARWPIALVLAPAAWFAWQLPSAPALAALAAFTLWSTWTLVDLYRGGGVGAAVHRLIAGMALFDLVVLAVAGAPAVASAVALLAFIATTALQRRIPGD
jgi:4-hydroxybenzoate polyprenyltransferase